MNAVIIRKIRSCNQFQQYTDNSSTFQLPQYQHEQQQQQQQQRSVEVRIKGIAGGVGDSGSVLPKQKVLRTLDDGCFSSTISSSTLTISKASTATTTPTTATGTAIATVSKQQQQQQDQDQFYPRISRSANHRHCSSPRKRRRGTYQIRLLNTGLPSLLSTTSMTTTIPASTYSSSASSGNATTPLLATNTATSIKTTTTTTTTTTTIPKTKSNSCRTSNHFDSNTTAFGFPLYFHSAYSVVMTLITYVPKSVQFHKFMTTIMNTKSSTSKTLITTTTKQSRYNSRTGIQLTKPVVRKCITLSVLCIVGITILIQVHGEHQLVLQNIINTRQVSSFSTFDNSNDNVVLVDDDTIKEQQVLTNKNMIKEVHSSTSSQQQEQQQNNHISFIRRNTEQRRHVYGNLTSSIRTTSHHHHAIPNIITFTHKYNLLTKRFPYDIDNATTPDEMEMLALQQNIHNIISFHPNATINFLTNKECIDSIQRVMTILYPDNISFASELVQYFQNETEGMFKGDLCRGVTLYETGGLYFDVDIGVRMNIWTVLPSWTEFVTVKVHQYSRDYGSFFQAFIGVIPHHPVIGKYIQYFYDYYRGILPFQNQLHGRPIGVVLLKRAYDAVQQEQLLQLQKIQQNSHDRIAEQRQVPLYPIQQMQRREEEIKNSGTPASMTHLDQTSLLWQETLYRRHMQRDPNFQNVPYPSWGMVRACRFIVVASSATTYVRGISHNIRNSGDSNDGTRERTSFSHHSATTVVPFYSRIANSRLCPVRPNYYTVPLLDWINYILFYH